jgi:protocatechuate 3,4-dioxygenase beta subunit
VIRGCVRSALILIPLILVAGACAPSPTATFVPQISSTVTPALAQAPTLNATAAPVALPSPDCRNGLTPAQTEGPYYKANTPERASLLQPDMPGTKVTLAGYVLTRDCRPVSGAWLDFWQADDKGQYDNGGYTLRGHQFTDGSGRYTLETILPGLYPGRTRHIHVKVRAPNQPILTTQLYFPEEQQNKADSIYDPKLLVTWQNTSGAKLAFYNLVLDVTP